MRIDFIDWLAVPWDSESGSRRCEERDGKRESEKHRAAKGSAHCIRREGTCLVGTADLA